MIFKLFCINSLVIFALLSAGCDQGKPTITPKADTDQLAADEEKDLNSITIRPELAARLAMISELSFPLLLFLGLLLRRPDQHEVHDRDQRDQGGAQRRRRARAGP